MGTRKSATKLTPQERDEFLEATLTLKNSIANPNDPPDRQINIYDQIVAIHGAVWEVSAPNTVGTLNFAHGGPAFLPWHREYLRRLELALQSVNPNVSLPYWDWTDHEGSRNILFQPDFLGPNGGPNGSGGGQVESGYFATNAPGEGNNPTQKPNWWPAGLSGWEVRQSLSDGLGTTLLRDFGTAVGAPGIDPFDKLATRQDVDRLFSTTGSTPLGQYEAFRTWLEGRRRMHNYAHGWVRGHMMSGNSPNDPIFFLHHCNVDRLWAMWQRIGHQEPDYYPGPNSNEDEGHKIDDFMWPWVGNNPGYQPVGLPPDIVLPDFSGEPSRTARDVLDHRGQGYEYEVIF